MTNGRRKIGLRRPTYVIELRGRDAGDIRHLRAILKTLLRRHRLRCVAARECRPTTDRAVADPRRRPLPTAPRPLCHNRAAVVATAILQILETAPPDQRRQAIEDYLRDELVDVGHTLDSGLGWDSTDERADDGQRGVSDAPF
jgi:hypothetical protein